MKLTNDEYKRLKAVAVKLKKKAAKLGLLLSQFNEKEAVVLSIQTMADINKISNAIILLQREVNDLNQSKLRSFKKEPNKLAENLQSERHNLRLLIGIVKGYSEMIMEDLSVNDTFSELNKKILLVLNLSKQITFSIDELRATSELLKSAIKTQKQFSNQAKNLSDSALIPVNKDAYVSESTVLIVDDSEANCELLTKWLQRKRFRTCVAGSGKQAFSLLEERSDIDIILLDIMMPFMDGYEVLLRIKSDERFANKMVIMISGMDEIDSVVRCIMSGAEDYLIKPFNPYLLSARIYACLEKKRLRTIESAYLEYLVFLSLPKK